MSESMQGPYDTLMHECASLEGGTSGRILIELENQTGVVPFSTHISEDLTLSSYLGHGISFQDSSGEILACSRIVTLSAVSAAHRGKTTFSQFTRILPAAFVDASNLDVLQYNILEGITGTCSRANILDPWSPRAKRVGQSVTPDQFPVGDLSNHHLELGIFLFEFSLIGSGTPLGHVVSSHTMQLCCLYHTCHARCVVSYAANG